MFLRCLTESLITDFLKIIFSTKPVSKHVFTWTKHVIHWQSFAICKDTFFHRFVGISNSLSGGHCKERSISKNCCVCWIECWNDKRFTTHCNWVRLALGSHPPQLEEWHSIILFMHLTLCGTELLFIKYGD